jgi:hypothetical protein
MGMEMGMGMGWGGEVPIARVRKEKPRRTPA